MERRFEGKMEGERPWFWPKKFNRRGAAAAAKDGEESDGFRFRFFLYFLLMLSKLPPPLVWLKMKAIYRQSSFFGLPNWSLKFCV